VARSLTSSPPKPCAQAGEDITELQPLWQIDEPLPLLAAEPAMMARPAAEARALKELVVAREAAVLAAVEAAHVVGGAGGCGLITGAGGRKVVFGGGSTPPPCHVIAGAGLPHPPYPPL
jgi:hypothetical protein